jgi:hypothetical protein
VSDECELCNIREETLWYYENYSFLVLDCKTCQTPMIIMKEHKGMPNFSENLAMEHMLKGVAWAVFGKNGFYIDRQMNTCTDHVHWHARSVRE